MQAAMRNVVRYGVAGVMCGLAILFVFSFLRGWDSGRPVVVRWWPSGGCVGVIGPAEMTCANLPVFPRILWIDEDQEAAWTVVPGQARPAWRPEVADPPPVLDWRR